MQNGDFYLHRNVYKNYSSSGTPYLAEHCNLKTSDNLIIYGHHMKNSTMFSNLDNYKNYNYYKNHKYIKFYTLEDCNHCLEGLSNTEALKLYMEIVNFIISENN